MKDQIIQEIHGLGNLERAKMITASTERVLVTEGRDCVYLRQSSADHTCELTIQEAVRLSIMLKAAAAKAAL